MPDVFISHAGTDTGYALALKERMERFGLVTFLDTASLQPGDDWEQVIRTNLKQSRTMLLLASRKAIHESRYVNQEIAVARDANIQIVPIVWDMPICDLPVELRQFQAIDLGSKRSLEEAENEILRLAHNLQMAKAQVQQNNVLMWGAIGLCLLVVFGKK